MINKGQRAYSTGSFTLRPRNSVEPRVGPLLIEVLLCCAFRLGGRIARFICPDEFGSDPLQPGSEGYRLPLSPGRTQTVANLGAESYRGVPLIGLSGRHMGHLAVLDTKPMEEKQRFIHTMQIFATRAAAELERVRAEDALADSLDGLRRAQATLIASKRAASQGRLAAALGHDLNNALSVLLANRDLSERYLSDLAEQCGNPAAVQRIVENATEVAGQSRAALQRITDAVKHLQRFTNIDRAGRRLVNITQLLDDAIGVLSGAWSNGITVLRDYAEDVPLLAVQPTGLGEVFSNILSNAAAALDGNGEIRVTTRFNMGYVQVRILDTGPGIEHERLSQIFEPGFRVKGNRVITGWGLFISRQIVHDHDGEFLLSSKPNQGTEVEVRLPVGQQMLRKSAQSEG